MRGLLLLTLSLFALRAHAEAPAELVILPLGDSITEGVPGDRGYRGFLAEELAQRSLRARFTGTRKSPVGAHEGWSGITADELLARVDPALTGTAPEIVLLHIGTNDIGLGQPGEAVVPEVTALLVRIGQRAPRARVLLAQIIPMSRAGKRYEEEVRKFNQSLPRIARERQASGQRVEIVNLHDALDPASDFHDALHPNSGGYRKLARAWAAALGPAAKSENKK
jgi:acyl-CoA thioesterase I